MVYSLFGWGIPLSVVGVGQILDQVIDPNGRYFITPNFGKRNTCWFTCTYSGNTIFLVGRFKIGILQVGSPSWCTYMVPWVS